jgi:hypothetical protein
MYQQCRFRLFASMLALTWLGGCGAMTIEPSAPEEPPTAARPSAPRLVRRDAGREAPDAATASE